MAEKFPLVSISDYLLCYARVAQLVEHQTFNLGVAGSNPATGTIYADIPQLVEDALGKRAVASSILARCSRLILHCLNVREQSSGPTGGRVMVATRLVTETT